VKLFSTGNVSPEIQRFAFSQDMIGWDNFMVGMISHHIRSIQYPHLLSAPTLLMVDDWMTQFIGKLLHITHGQWIYRNISKYHESIGHIRKTERRESLLEIDRLMHLRPEELPEESKFLLEVNFARLRRGDLTSQHYWVHAIKAALAAKARKTFLQRRQRAAPCGRRPVTTTPPVPYGQHDEVQTADRSAGHKRMHQGAGSADDKANKRKKPN
jgi:hypothetical protein